MVAQVDDVWLGVSFSGFFFTQIDVTGAQLVVAQQRGIKRQLRVFLRFFHALCSHLARLAFVVHHQRPAVWQAVDAVYFADEGEFAQRHFFPLLRFAEAAAAGFVLGEPGQIAFAHLGPCGGKGQKLAVSQTEFARGPGCGRVDQTLTARQIRRGRSQQRHMKMAQQCVQPVTEVALAQLAFELIDGLQLELTHGKKAVRTAP